MSLLHWEHKGDAMNLHLWVCAQSLSCVQPLVTPWTVAHQACLSMGFSMQEYWSRLPFPTPGDLPDPGIITIPPVLAGRFLTTELPRKPSTLVVFGKHLF